MKYVVINPFGLEVAIVFPESVCHSSVVNRKEVAPVSAGFCNITPTAITVHGHSLSLNVASRPQDAEIIERTLTHLHLR